MNCVVPGCNARAVWVNEEQTEYEWTINMATPDHTHILKGTPELEETTRTGYIKMEISLHGMPTVRSPEAFAGDIEKILRRQYGLDLDSDCEVEVIESAGYR